MAVETIGFNPGLTPERVREVFARHFDGRCRIEDWHGVNIAGTRRDFVVVKNAFVGVSVRLEQGSSDTKFVYTGLAPRAWARAIASGVLGVLASYLFWNGLTHEVRDLIETAPEFREGAVAAA
ncbi:MAG TPA: hypothetical protein VFX12_02955 [Vicinamibacterales bacterium]|jgi:hypothetical protein|nr:hypothetical protein [Vicinamibacterales bacterium]